MFSKWRVALLALLLAAPEWTNVSSASSPAVPGEDLPRRIPVALLANSYDDDYALLLAEGYIDPEQQLHCVPPGTVWEDRVTYDEAGQINVHTLCSPKRPFILPTMSPRDSRDPLVPVTTVDQLNQLFVSSVDG